MDAKSRPTRTTNSPEVVEDTRVAQEVARALAASGRFLQTGLQIVSAPYGRVTLRGRVSSYYHKQVVQVAALSVPGVRELHKELDVVSTP